MRNKTTSHCHKNELYMQGTRNIPAVYTKKGEITTKILHTRAVVLKEHIRIQTADIHFIVL